MQIHLFLTITSVKKTGLPVTFLQKVVESDFRPVAGDILDDPGFDSRYHNGYEVVKVTVNYATNTCLVSLSPLAIEIEEMDMDNYVEKLVANGWQVLEKGRIAQEVEGTLEAYGISGWCYSSGPER